MLLKFRTKLSLLVGVAGLSLLLVVMLDAFSAAADEELLERIEARYLPLLELAPQVNAQLEGLRRTFQDAAAAADDAQLDAAAEARDRLAASIHASRQVIASEDISTLQLRLDRYYEAAHQVTRRIIAGETGEALLGAMEAMQARQRGLAEALTKALSFDRDRLARAFNGLREARARAARNRIFVALLCLFIVMVISLRIARRLTSALDELTAGFARFGEKEFGRPIRILSGDEIGEVAKSANEMARQLLSLGARQEIASWLTSGQAQLARELQGDLAPEQVAARATSFLARYIGAPVAALYAVEDQHTFRLLAGHALSSTDSAQGAEVTAGLLEHCRERGQVVRLQDIPEDYLRIRSGLGEARPRAVWIVPISHLGTVIAVLELAVLAETPPGTEDLLSSVRDSIAVTLHASWAQATRQRLLRETQEQAHQLAEQEDELRAINEELTAQQEELRVTNEELTQQTEEREAQRKVLADRNRELEAIRERLQQQTVQLESVSRYKSQFLANMSHELRTPLNSMLLLSDLLARNESGELTEKQVEFAATIHAAGKDLLGLINQVLDLAKIEAGKLDVRSELVPIGELLLHLRRVYEPTATSKGLAFQLDIDASVPATITSDRARIEQVLTNLIGNAIKFTDRGSVAVRVTRAMAGSPGVVFSVQDTGVGIAPENMTRIFEAFEQIDGGSQRRHGGTGLGLSIARQLAQLLGGELTARSELGKGSVFELQVADALPAEAIGSTVRRDGEPRRPSLTREEGLVADAGLRARSLVRPSPDADSLLIIEDDLLFAERIVTLANEAGLNALLAKDGATGIRLARVHRPRGIVLDVRLPDLDGFAVIEALRQHEESRQIPVHIVSCADEDGRAQSLGAIGYLRKPASREDLLRVIDRLVPPTLRRVLVIEDDRQLGGSLAALLAEHGIEAHCVASGELALSAMREQRFACVILDLGLPDIDGLEILARMHGDSLLPKLPVIVHTGRSLSKTELRRLEAYTEGIVLKGDGSNERVLEELRLFLNQLSKPERPAATPRFSFDTTLLGKKILVADDDMRTVYALSALLRGKGMEVLLADTGRTAVDTLLGDPSVDAVIMDIMMPELDGYEAMREIRRDPRFRRLPIIALTAKAMHDDRVRCVEAGASDYMPKPVDGERLLSLLQAWLVAS